MSFFEKDIKKLGFGLMRLPQKDGAIDIEPTVIETCLCGYFHTFSKAANQLLKRCMKLGLLVAHNGNMTIVNNNEKTTNHGI